MNVAEEIFLGLGKSNWKRGRNEAGDSPFLSPPSPYSKVSEPN